jgi:hypothetical protein
MAQLLSPIGEVKYFIDFKNIFVCQCNEISGPAIRAQDEVPAHTAVSKRR